MFYVVFFFVLLNACENNSFSNANSRFSLLEHVHFGNIMTPRNCCEFRILCCEKLYVSFVNLTRRNVHSRTSADNVCSYEGVLTHGDNGDFTVAAVNLLSIIYTVAYYAVPLHYFCIGLEISSNDDKTSPQRQSFAPTRSGSVD